MNLRLMATKKTNKNEIIPKDSEGVVIDIIDKDTFLVEFEFNNRRLITEINQADNFEIETLAFCHS